MVLVEVFDVRGAWPATESADGDYFVRCGVVYRDGCDAAEVGSAGERYIDGDTGGDACVDRVATFLEDAISRGGGKVVACPRPCAMCP